MKNEDRPLVSVLMTAYNREKYIAEAIESVLASTYTNYELIIVDDCSKDRTVEIARSYETKDGRIKIYVNKQNLGDYPNRNIASRYAEGKYLKYVDSDDLIYHYTLEYMVGEMEKYPQAAFGISSRTETHTTIFSSKDAYTCHFFQRGLLDYGPTAAIILRERFETWGRFKEIRNVSDGDLWLKLAARYPVVEMKKNLVYWREHPQQEIRIATHYYDEYNLSILTEHLLHNECPLSAQEVQLILKKERRQLSRKLIKNVIKRFETKSFNKLWKKNNLSIKDLL